MGTEKSLVSTTLLRVVKMFACVSVCFLPEDPYAYFVTVDDVISPISDVMVKSKPP